MEKHADLAAMYVARFEDTCIACRVGRRCAAAPHVVLPRLSMRGIKVVQVWICEASVSFPDSAIAGRKADLLISGKKYCTA